MRQHRGCYTHYLASRVRSAIVHELLFASEKAMKLQDLQPDATVRGILPDALVTVVSVEWHGSDAMTLVYRGPTGKVADEILYRHDEMRLEIVETGRPWSFDGDGSLFRLVAEALRIRLAHLFDPVLAVHTSLVDPLPPSDHRCLRGNAASTAVAFSSRR